MKSLLELGADPRCRDSCGLVPFSLIRSGEAGQEMRRAMREWAGLHPNLFTWEEEAKLVPLYPMSEQEIEAKKAKEKAKEKARKARSKAKAKQEKEDAEAVRTKQEQERLERETKLKLQREESAVVSQRAAQLEQAYQARQQQIKGMSDREKRALAAEERMKAMKNEAKRCAYCDKAITSVPFERLQYKYDSLNCLGEHRRQLDKEEVKTKPSSSSSVSSRPR